MNVYAMAHLMFQAERAAREYDVTETGEQVADALGITNHVYASLFSIAFEAFRADTHDQAEMAANLKRLLS